MAGKHKTRLVGWHPSDPQLVGWLDAEIERRGGGRGAQSAILDEALKEAAMNGAMLTDADRSLIARARTLAGIGDEAALRQHTGETDGVLACFRALGEARDLLGAMADRLDPPAQATVPDEEEDDG
jgi:hypothetical protein